MATSHLLSRPSQITTPAKTELRAGPLSMVLQEGDLRYIRLGSTELVRRICVLVRGTQWQTLPRVVSQLQIRSDESSFSVSYECSSKSGTIDYRWHTEISGDSDGSILFAFDGRALSSFLSNRIGLCVLHPIAECAGTPCTVLDEFGATQEKSFPARISPWQLFTSVRALCYEPVAGVGVRLNFSGDVFETEDQRNWTDASYKTYSRPLSLPWPFAVEKDETHSQSLSMSVSLAGDLRRRQVSQHINKVELSLVTNIARALPQIGTVLASGVELTEKQIERLKSLQLGYLSVPLDLSSPSYPSVLALAKEQAALLGLPLEIVPLLPAGKGTESLSLLKDHLGDYPVCQWLFEIGNREDGDTTREAYADFPNSFFGSVHGFVAVNRNPSALRKGHGTWFAIDPQVHASDNDTLVENLVAQAWAVEQARDIAGGTAVAVSSLGLASPTPRSNTHATEPARDPRHGTLFGAAWSTGSLKYLSEAGTASVTFYSTAGAGGLIPLPPDAAGKGQRETLDPGVFPHYHVFADVAEYRTGEVLSLRSTDPLAVDGIALRQGRQHRLLLANFHDQRKQLSVRIDRPFDSARITYLDETNVNEAMYLPEQYRKSASKLLPAHLGRIEFSAPPCSISRIDFTTVEAAV